MRGHLHANLDPLGLEQRHDHGELHPQTYGFTDEDYDRKIFIDGVLGLQYATLSSRWSRSCAAPIAARSASNSCISPIRRKRPGCRRASKARRRRSSSRSEGKRAILNKLVEAEGFEKFLDVKYTGTKRFGLDGARIHRSGAGADHQARRRARRAGNRARHGPSRPSQRALAR